MRLSPAQWYICYVEIGQKNSLIVACCITDHDIAINLCKQEKKHELPYSCRRKTTPCSHSKSCTTRQKTPVIHKYLE